jgi:hypothetical protein
VFVFVVVEGEDPVEILFGAGERVPLMEFPHNPLQDLDVDATGPSSSLSKEIRISAD